MVARLEIVRLEIVRLVTEQLVIEWFVFVPVPELVLVLVVASVVELDL